VRVLVVDDSVVFRSQIKTALDGVPGIEVVGTANNGKIALQKLAQSSVDLITLDIEMPEMGGIETIREIKKAKFPVKIIVFSSHTRRGSESALEALASGAHDFVSKPAGDDINFETAAKRIRDELLPKVQQFASMQSGPLLNITQPRATPAGYLRRDLDTFRPEVIVIGSSTGGPPALEKVLSIVGKVARLPILIAQHMPPVFTASLAKRLSEATGIAASEATHGEPIVGNHIYVAPGNFHMSVAQQGGRTCAQLDQNPPRNSVRPAVDVLFESAAKCWGPKVLSVVLTGMGEDGLVGARAVKEKMGGVLIQNQASCVVFGMPGAISAAGFFDEAAPLERIGEILRKVST
jgi:two-component system chemotaxis response regulator CheB